MAIITIVFGGLLITLGILGYFLSDSASVTALIPAFFGVVLEILGLLAMSESRRKLVMHIAVVVVFAGILGSFSGLFEIGNLLAGTAARPMAVISKSLMAVICAILFGLYVNSFIQARKK